MRRLLVENARRKRRLRHGGGRQRIDLDCQLLVSDAADDALIALDEALARHKLRFDIVAQSNSFEFLRHLVMRDNVISFQIGIGATSDESRGIVTRDIDVLQRLSEANEVTVNVSLATLDPAIARRLELRSQVQEIVDLHVKCSREVVEGGDHEALLGSTLT